MSSGMTLRRRPAAQSRLRHRLQARPLDRRPGRPDRRPPNRVAPCGPFPRGFWARHYRIGARCRDGWRSDATGSGACSHHGGVAEWLYADDRIVHETRTGREIGTVKWSAPMWADTYAKRPITTCRSTRLPRCAMRPSRSGSGSAYRHARARPRPVRLLLPTGPVIRVERADGRVDHRGSPPLAHSASRHAQ